MIQVKESYPFSSRSTGNSTCWVYNAAVGGRWIEQGAVGFASTRGFGHGVVDFEEAFFSAVAAMGLLVLQLLWCLTIHRSPFASQSGKVSPDFIRLHLS